MIAVLLTRLLCIWGILIEEEWSGCKISLVVRNAVIKQGSQLMSGKELGSYEESHFNAGTEGILSTASRRGPAWGGGAVGLVSRTEIEAFVGFGLASLAPNDFETATHAACPLQPHPLPIRRLQGCVSPPGETLAAQ